MEEFGDPKVTASLDAGISTPNELEPEDGFASNTDGIDLDEFPWVGRSLGELEDTPPVASQNSGKIYFQFWQVVSFMMIQYCLQMRLNKYRDVLELMDDCELRLIS